MATKEPARESLMGWYSQRFGEDVGQVPVAFDVEELEHLLRDPVSNHMVFHIDVLGAPVVHHVLRDAASSDVVKVSSDGQDDSDQLVEEIPEVQTLSAGVGSRDVLSFGGRG
jgi:hypothetical protein